jgi:aldehyde dehydrogenase (NAD+)
VFEHIYEEFVDKLVAKAKSLTLGITDGCDLGPVVNKSQYTNILGMIGNAKESGGVILCGGRSPDDPELQHGYYIMPTVITELGADCELNKTEIFWASCYSAKSS